MDRTLDNFSRDDKRVLDPYASLGLELQEQLVLWHCGAEFLDPNRDDRFSTRARGEFMHCMEGIGARFADRRFAKDLDAVKMYGKDEYGGKTRCGFSVTYYTPTTFSMFIMRKEDVVAKALLEVQLEPEDIRDAISIEYLCADSTTYSKAGSNMIKEVARVLELCFVPIMSDRNEAHLSLTSTNDSFYDNHTPLVKETNRYGIDSGQYSIRSSDPNLTTWSNALPPISRRNNVIDLTLPDEEVIAEDVPEPENVNREVIDLTGSGLIRPGKYARRAAEKIFHW